MRLFNYRAVQINFHFALQPIDFLDEALKLQKLFVLHVLALPLVQILSDHCLDQNLGQIDHRKRDVVHRQRPQELSQWVFIVVLIELESAKVPRALEMLISLGTAEAVEGEA